MDFFLLIISLALPVAGGAFFVRYILKGASGAGAGEVFFFGLAAGPGVLAFLMFMLGLAGLPFSRVSVGIPLLVFTIVFLALSLMAKKGAASAAGPPPGLLPRLQGWRRNLFIFLAAWVALKTGFVFYESLTRPIFTVDSYLNWAISAKFFYYNAGLVLDPANEHFFGKGYRFFIGHPLHLPLFQTWIALMLGRFHEVYIKAPVALYFMGTLGVLYHAIRREAGPFYAMVTVFFMASVPIFTGQGQDAYADLPLAFFALSGVAALWRFLRDDNHSYLILSGILLGMAAFIKNEGLFFPAACGAALLLFLLIRRRSSAAPIIAPLAAFVIPIIIIAGPWFLFKMHHGIGFGHSGASSSLDWLNDPFYHDSAARGVHWEVIGKGLYVTFFTANYNLIFPLWIVAGLLARKIIMRGELKYLYMIILLLISMYVFVYLTLEVATVTEQTGIHRNTLTYLPIVFFATTLTLSRLWPQSRSRPAFDRQGP